MLEVANLGQYRIGCWVNFRALLDPERPGYGLGWVTC